MPEEWKTVAPAGAGQPSGAAGTRIAGDGGFHPDSHPGSPNGLTDHSALAVALEPALIQACDGDLSRIEWFRSTWQSGGAATGRARFALTDGRSTDVIVKLPVGPAEYVWTRGMEGMDAPEGAHCELTLGCTPRVFAAGLELGGYDLAWLVVERLPGHPLSHRMDQQAAHDLLESAAEWYERAARLRPVDREPPRRDWAGVLGRAREALKNAEIPYRHRWVEAVKHVQRALPRLVDRWESRPINAWCHGDLHPGNAMRRAPDPGENGSGKVVLIDLALVHPGHWVEDALYLERLYWGHAELLHGVKPVSTLARIFRDRGLQTDEDYTMLANVRRVLMAASVPAFLAREGNPKYVQAALEIVERLLPAVTK